MNNVSGPFKKKGLAEQVKIIMTESGDAQELWIRGFEKDGGDTENYSPAKPWAPSPLSDFGYASSETRPMLPPRRVRCRAQQRALKSEDNEVVLFHL